ncbi:hypothetical protein [Sorangium cellulosum]|uniref:hypothetical protein n=1 Tax=Sorangium TaxID=39643 RepID=UPI001F3E6009|nr:hypothetical protein [Sorangium cellulosum]
MHCDAIRTCGFSRERPAAAIAEAVQKPPRVDAPAMIQRRFWGFAAYVAWVAGADGCAARCGLTLPCADA